MDKWLALKARANCKLSLAWFDCQQEVAEATRPQYGEASNYPQRRPDNSKLDPELSLAEQFNVLRVVDNQLYQAFFHWHIKNYILNLTELICDIGTPNYLS